MLKKIVRKAKNHQGTSQIWSLPANILVGTALLTQSPHFLLSQMLISLSHTASPPPPPTDLPLVLISAIRCCWKPSEHPYIINMFCPIHTMKTKRNASFFQPFSFAHSDEWNSPAVGKLLSCHQGKSRSSEDSRLAWWQRHQKAERSRQNQTNIWIDYEQTRAEQPGWVWRNSLTGLTDSMAGSVIHSIQVRGSRDRFVPGEFGKVNKLFWAQLSHLWAGGEWMMLNLQTFKSLSRRTGSVLWHIIGFRCCFSSLAPSMGLVNLPSHVSLRLGKLPGMWLTVSLMFYSFTPLKMTLPLRCIGLADGELGMSCLTT